MSATAQYVGPGAVYPGLPTPTSLQNTIGSYIYQEYADDNDLQAFVIAQNGYSQAFLNWMNGLNLPIYTGGVVSGSLLDWVGQGLYGMDRPSITTGSVRSVGGINAAPINVIPIAGRKTTSTETLQSCNDDIYRRMLTWNFYKGDGFQFTVEWLKRRVYRFLNGPNGVAPIIDNTYAVSVAMAGTQFLVAVQDGSASMVATLNALVKAQECITPFEYSFTVTSVVGTTNLYSDAGVLCVLPAAGYPSAGTLPGGSIYSNGGVVSVVPSAAPIAGTPVFFGAITAAQLLAQGSAGLGWTPPAAGSKQLWIPGGANGGDVWIA